MLIFLFLSILNFVSKSFADEYTKPCINKEKLCFADPSDCIIKGNCDILVRTFSLNNGVRFEMLGKVTEKDRWFAVGLSDDENMGQDSVVLCLASQNSNLIINDMYNGGRYTPEANRNITYFNESISYKDGYLFCQWTRKPKTYVSHKEFDIFKNKYHLLLAKGDATPSNAISKHDRALASKVPLDLKSVSIVSSSVHYLIKLHGALMLIAWIGLVSISIMIARHYKSSWSDQELCGLKIWFILHRGIMITAIIFVVLGMSSIFVYVGGWRGTNVHPYLGICANILMFFQPIMALFRCASNHPKRPIFNWIHWSFGNIAHILAITAVFFSTYLQSTNIHPAFLWVLAVYIASHVLVHLIMQLHSIFLSSRKISDDIQLQEVNQRGNSDEDRRGDGFRQFMLGLYVVIMTTFTLALILFTVMDRSTSV